jgi:hypothetical protein
VGSILIGSFENGWRTPKHDWNRTGEPMPY